MKKFEYSQVKEFVRIFWKRCCQSARLMVGIPDYEKYLDHMKEAHPNHPVMTKQEFYKRAIEMRYPSSNNGGKIKKCPC